MAPGATEAAIPDGMDMPHVVTVRFFRAREPGTPPDSIGIAVPVGTNESPR